MAHLKKELESNCSTNFNGGSIVDIVVEVCSNRLTLKQSAASLRLGDTLSVMGFVGGEHGRADVLNFLDP